MELADDNIFGSFLGLPLHPLVIHLAVVVLPAAALAVIALVFVRRWRDRYGWLTMCAVVVGAAGAFLAKESGEALAARVGLPADHAEWGDRLFVTSGVFMVVSLVWFFAQRRAGALRSGDRAAIPTSTGPADPGEGMPVRALGWAAALVSLAVVALAVVTGHSGATAVWGHTLTPVSAPKLASSPRTVARGRPEPTLPGARRPAHPPRHPPRPASPRPRPRPVPGATAWRRSAPTTPPRRAGPW